MIFRSELCEQKALKATMKARTKNPLLSTVLMVGLSSILDGRVTAQTFTTLHNFTGGRDGANPVAGLITNLSGTTLDGTAYGGGSSGNGTVFSISFRPQLRIIPSGADVILSWPTNYAGFTLQSTTNLVSQVSTTNSPAPVVINGQNTVTNPISGTTAILSVKPVTTGISQ